MERHELDGRVADWLNALPPFVQAVTVGGDDFLKGTGEPFVPSSWKARHEIQGWTVMTVTETSIRFRRRNVQLDEGPLPY